MKFLIAVAASAAIAAALLYPSPHLRVVRFPPGVTEVHTEIAIDGGTEVFGGVLHAAADFSGRAILVVRGNRVRLHDLTIDGNRDALEIRAGLPPSDVPFEKFTRANGLLAIGVSQLTVRHVSFRNIAGLAILVSRSRDIAIDRVMVADSGSRNPLGRNNTTGGILLEEGAADFRVTGCDLRRIRGNGLWTHSLYTSPRNARGVFALNSFAAMGRDAIQVGHATDVRVEGNAGVDIGSPASDVDIESRAIPAAIDTAGNVERCVYSENRFDRVNGKCIDLDGFHDGAVTGNTCRNLANYGIVMNNTNPDMRSENILISGNTISGARFGGIFVIGTGHHIVDNHLLDLNTARCNEAPICYYAPGEPDMLRSGIYLGRGAERPDPARGNVIQGNQITGFQMNTRCIGFAPGVTASSNTVRGNTCSAETLPPTAAK